MRQGRTICVVGRYPTGSVVIVVPLVKVPGARVPTMCTLLAGDGTRR